MSFPEKQFDKLEKNDKDSSENISEELFKTITNEELNAVDPSRKNRKQATPEQLANPFHGVKLKEVLDRLVDFYGWEYLGERTNIRCFKYNPNRKSSLGFLRKTQWAREFVEDVYLEMLDDIEKKENESTK
ncbi:VF530 family protein [Flavicella sp.]|uniref:VF530 family protein n=1 Tax=Flavicella sp. TaxID=2957742 RepID=UPI00343B4593